MEGGRELGPFLLFPYPYTYDRRYIMVTLEDPDKIFEKSDFIYKGFWYETYHKIREPDLDLSQDLKVLKTMNTSTIKTVIRS